MYKKIFSFFIFYTLFFFEFSGQHFPGGVSGAEMWYIANADALEDNEYVNSCLSGIEISNCSDYSIYEHGLLNFNPAIDTDKLCLLYRGSLENTEGRNIFFVGEPVMSLNSMSHVETQWGNHVDTDSIFRNTFNFNDKDVFVNMLSKAYHSNNNAHINYYHFNNYDIDKKFKSFGLRGETNFIIGKYISFAFERRDFYFSGLFPELISYPFQLSYNERNRIESYLALKYGITLSPQTTYRNSKNLVFWYKKNNDLFPNRIFGIGKDSISSLNQLQAESAHLKKYLIASVGELLDTNLEKQQDTIIPDNHFIVFGDTGGNGFNPINEQGVRTFQRKWLAQVTGEEASDIPIYLQLDVTDPVLSEYLTAGYNLWLLRDSFISNNEVSDFESEYVIYYEPDYIDAEIAIFKNIYFDTDNNIFDQFTFGIGPDMIVQVQVTGCDGDDLEVNVVITGGTAPYDITVTPPAIYGFPYNYNNITENIYEIDTYGSGTYTVEVWDDTVNYVEIEFELDPWDIWVDLGPDQNLSESEPTILLEADTGVSDPNATYQWYKDGELLVLLPPNTYEYLVSEPGEYKVVVTTEDQTCQVEDTILIGYDYGVEVVGETGCTQEENKIYIYVYDGTPYFLINVNNGLGFDLNYSSDGDTVLMDFPYGTYQVTVTDSDGNGTTYIDTVEFYLDIDLNIYTQLEDICGSCLYIPPLFGLPEFTYNEDMFVLDASLLVEATNVSYEWFEDGISTEVYTPQYTFNPAVLDCNVKTNNSLIYTVKVTDNDSGCELSQSFKWICPQLPEFTGGEDEEPVETVSLRSMVYPNPSDPHSVFYYHVYSEEVFEGTIEIINVLGMIVNKKNISGNSNYTLTFELPASGTYLIRTVSSLGITVVNKVIIK